MRGWLTLVVLCLVSCAHRPAGPSAPPPPLAAAAKTAIFDPAAQVEGRPPRGSTEPLTVLDVQPRDRSRGEPIQVRFSRSVAQADALPPVSLVVEQQERDGSWSHVAGVTRWYRTDRLLFEPEEPLPDAHLTRVRLEGEVGEVGEIAWEFETWRPTVSVIEDRWEPFESTEPISVWVDQPTTAQSLRNRVTVTNGRGRKLRIHVKAASQEERDDVAYEAESEAWTLLLVEPAKPWPAGATLDVTVSAKFRTATGVLPMGTAFTAKLKTRPKFRILGLDCPERDGTTCPLGPITIRLSTDAWVLDQVRMVPEPDGFEVYDAGDDEQAAIEIDGDFEPGTRYEVVFPRKVEDAYEQRITGRRRIPVRFSEVRAKGQADLELSVRSGIYGSVEDARIGVLSHRVLKADVRVAVLDANAGLPFVTAPSTDPPPWPKGGRQSSMQQTMEAGSRHRYVSFPLELGTWAKAGDTVLVEVRAVTLAPRSTGDPPPPVRGVYRISNLGMFAHSGPARGIVRVTDLATGRPRSNVAVTLRGEDASKSLGKTDRHGLVSIPAALDIDTGSALVARVGSDALAMPLKPFAWKRHDGWVTRRYLTPGLRYGRRKPAKGEAKLPPGLKPGERGLVAIAVGRGVYMPGDTVHVAGWAGISTPHGDHNTRRVAKGTPVELVLLANDDEIATGKATINAHGRFSKTLMIPEGASLGSYRVEATVLDARFATGFVVEEPRIPTFELAATVKRKKVTRGDPIRLEARATYLSGEAAPMHRAYWTVDCHASNPYFDDLPEGFSTRTNAEIPSWHDAILGQPRKRSALMIDIPTDALDHRAGRSCHISISAQDGSHQPVGAEASAFVHPGPGYLAARVPDVAAGRRGKVGVIAVDQTGRRVAADAVRVEVHRQKEHDKLALLSTCRLGAVARTTVGTCRTPRLKEGVYVVRVLAELDEHPVELERNIVVYPPPKPEPPPPPPPRPSARKPAKPPLRVKAPRDMKAGEAATVELTAPWPNAHGVLTVEQTGLRESIPFKLRGGKTTLRVTPRFGAGPRLELTARVARPADGRHKPQIKSASTWSKVEDRTQLDVTVDAPTRVRPGTKTRFKVRVQDGHGTPVPARLAIWVVDDGLHQLRPPRHPGLAQVFNPDRPSMRTVTDMHPDLQDPFAPRFGRFARRSPRVRQAKAMVKGALDPEIRQRFDAAPLFVGDVGTGPDGVVEIPLQLPDDLTRFRISVAASAELGTDTKTGPARFGWAGEVIEVSAPLNVRAALPRILRPRDEAELAALVTASLSGTLAVSVQASGDAVRVEGPTTRRRQVRRGEVVRVPFRVRAGSPGSASIQLTAALQPTKGKSLRGGVERALTVQVDRTAIERAAVYGSVATDRPIAVPVQLPSARHGEIKVAVTSTALGDLDDAAEYLEEYPYGCVEQTASRIVPLVALRGLGRRAPDAEATLAKAVAYLQTMQLSDGHFAYWPGDNDVSPFGTAYATWILLMARDAGHVVPMQGIQRALEALARDATAELPANARARDRALVNRALAVRALAHAGDVPPAALHTLWAHREHLPTFARLFVLQALHRADADDPRIEPLLASVLAKIEQRPAVAHVVDASERPDRWWFSFSSPTRTDALALQTLLAVAPKDPRVEKLARGLRESRRAGRWRNTQENAFALLALSSYAREREAVAPAHSIEAWIGPRRVLQAKVRGFDQVRRGGGMGLSSALASADTNRKTHVVLARRGDGRAYYRVGVEWEPRKAPARAQGLTLTRTLANRTLAAGDPALIEIELSTDTPQRFIAVEVPLPAGLEAVNTALGRGMRARVLREAVTSDALSHQELRPDRVLLFFDTLAPGSTRHSIPVVATTPGRYTVPAAVAEAMYEPETRARTTKTTLEISP